jgi:hypothetical protein
MSRLRRGLFCVGGVEGSRPGMRRLLFGGAGMLLGGEEVLLGGGGSDIFCPLALAAEPVVAGG